MNGNGQASKKAIIVICFLLFILIVYFLAKSSVNTERVAKIDASEAGSVSVASGRVNSSSLPPPGEPLAVSSKILLLESNSGNSQAAARLFNDSRECLETSRLKALLPELQGNRIAVLDPKSAIGRSFTTDLQRQLAIAQIDANINKANSGQALCQGSAPILANGNIYNIALQAAELGNSDAAACLLSAPYESGPVNDLQGKQFMSQAYRLADEAVARGSWQAAIALSQAYSGQTKGSGLAAYSEQINPGKEYQYKRLIRLGLPDGSPDAAALDAQLSAMQAGLSPSQTIQADQWANQTYKNSFFFSGTPSPSTSPCEF